MAAVYLDPLEREGRLDELVVTYLEAVERGEALDPHEWTSRHPELATDLAEFFADHHKVESWTEPLRHVALARSTAATDLDLTTDDSPNSVPAGEVGPLDDYKLLEEIDRGGMGIVYRARQVSLQRIVAL